MEDEQKPEGLEDLENEKFAPAKLVLRDPNEIENDDACAKIHAELKGIIERDGIEHVLNHIALYLLLHAQQLDEIEDGLEQKALATVGGRVLDIIPFITAYRKVAGLMDPLSREQPLMGLINDIIEKAMRRN